MGGVGNKEKKLKDQFNEQEKNESIISKLNILNYIGQKREYFSRFKAYGDDDYGAITYLRKCNKNKVFLGNFQCFAYDEYLDKYFSWGLNNYGQLGQNTSINYLQKNTGDHHFFDSLGEFVYFSDKIQEIRGNIKIQYMAFGDGFTIASDDNNTVYSWGLGEECQLGYELKFSESDLVNGKKCRLNPTKVFTSSSQIVDLQCGKDFSFVLNSDKRVYAWGSNNEQQILPHKYYKQDNKHIQYFVRECQEIDVLSDMEFKQIKLGWSHAIAIRYNSDVYIWGKIEDHKKYDEITRLDIGNETASSVSSGFSHSLIQTTMNGALSVGDNTYVR